MTFNLTACFHPSHRFPGGLEETWAWFERVFGRTPIPQNTDFVVDEFPSNYCHFTMIQEVLFDTIDPVIFPSNLNPMPEAGNPPHLGGIAWYVDDHDALVRAFKEKGVRLLDGRGNPVEGDMAPGNPLQPDYITMTFSDARQIGFPYEFYTLLNDSRHHVWARKDARILKDWTLPPVSPSDPLRLERCAWHTMLTDKPERMLALFVDLLGGEVIHSAENPVLGTQSTYVALADGVYEIGKPIREGFAMDDWSRHFRGDDDCYHGITFKTADLDQVRRHLKEQDISLVADTENHIVTDARDSIGVYWGFVSALIPGDMRG